MKNGLCPHTGEKCPIAENLRQMSDSLTVAERSDFYRVETAAEEALASGECSGPYVEEGRHDDILHCGHENLPGICEEVRSALGGIGLDAVMSEHMATIQTNT